MAGSVGPCFEDLSVGDVFGAPAMTLTAGHAALHQAIAGDRLRLPLDHDLARRVTGESAPPAHPALVWDVCIGQSTQATRNVVANLFYRGLAFRRFPCLGDTLHTTTEVVALRQNRPRPERRSTGLAVLRVRSVDQEQRAVLDFWRCAMLPLRDDTAVTGHDDDVHAPGRDAVDDDGRAAVYTWDLAEFRHELSETNSHAVEVGTTIAVEGGDVVTAAPELARLTLNLARVHHDGGEDGGGGEPLVYGGHTVGLALAQACRALPDLVTITAWQQCDHLAPVRQGMIVRSTLSVEGMEPLPGGGTLLGLRSQATGQIRGDPQAEPVLDWRFTALAP